MRVLGLLLLLGALIGGAVAFWVRTSSPPPAPPPQPAPALPGNSTPTPATREVQVYFAREVRPPSERGYVLVPVQREAEPARPATAALQALAVGPTTEERAQGLVATLPVGTRVLGVKVEGGVATANLSREVQEKFNGGAEWEEIVLYSIVDTLTAVQGVQGVRIHVEGAPVESIGGHMGANELLQRDATLIAPGKAQ